MESNRNKYKPLLEIRLFYHFDKTGEDFYLLPVKERERWMYSYDCRHFFTIESVEENILKKNRILYKKTALGCTVLIPDTHLYEDDIKFEFIVKVTDANLLSYTGEITFVESNDHENRTRVSRRYKEIFMFSNATETEEKIHFVSAESPSVIKHDYFPEYKLLLSENILECKQLSQNSTKCKALLPKVFHDDIFAFISLTSIKNPYESVGSEKHTHPVFEINFEKYGGKKIQSVMDKDISSNSGFFKKMKNSLLS